MNKYEKDNLKRIINEIAQLDKHISDLSQLKKAYYLFHKLGEIYKYKTEFLLTDVCLEYEDKIKIYSEGTSETGEAICTDMNIAYCEGLNELGIKAELIYEYDDSFIEENFSHADVLFKTTDGNYYIANLVPDIMHIQTGMKTRNFGMDFDDIKRKPIDNKKEYLSQLNKNTEGKGLTKVSEEEIRNLDNEFGFTYKGLYTNEVIDLLEKETSNVEFMKKFFKTTDDEELTEKKIEFLMNKIGIINKKSTIGNEEALEYYQKMFLKMFSTSELENIDILRCFENNNKNNMKSIIVFKKEKENVYYLYNKETLNFEKKNKVDLEKENISNLLVNGFERKYENIHELINRYENRLKSIQNNSNERDGI